MSKKQIQEQFGEVAEAYATSIVHASGASLGRLVEILPLKADWRALDVAAAAGHTAHAIAPFVSEVVAMDLTYKMMPVAARLTGEKHIDNVMLVQGDAEHLPFNDSNYDLVTCRLATHHFSDLPRFMAECTRVLRPGGLLAIVDNVVPGGGGKGKKAQIQRDAGRYINAFDKLRDPSHVRCPSLSEWQSLFENADFQLTHVETLSHYLDFEDWVTRMRVAQSDVIRLAAMLGQAPTEVREFLRPESRGARKYFRLEVAILVAGR